MNLRELSEKLGLSQTTVSRALNGYPEVNKATRQRVEDAAREFKYRPNQRATSLATGRTMCIGHVIPFSTQHEMVNVVFSDFIAGAGEIYAKHGYDLRMSVVSDAEEAQAYARLAENGAVDGVIVHGPIEDDPRIPMLRKLGLPFVVHGRSSKADPGYAFLDVDNTRAIERATRFLLDLGHRRIGFINGLERMDFALRRRAGYVSGLASQSILPDPELMFSDEMTEPNGHRAAKEMLELPNPPTAFFASSIIPALGVRRAVEERGLTVGKDVSIICFDDEISYLPNGRGDPIFTAARSSVRAAGRRCAEMLLAQISQGVTHIETELWEADLVVGQSTGPALTND
jgi:LacI family transcriptional regulator